MRKNILYTDKKSILISGLFLLLLMAQTSFAQKIPKSFNIALSRSASALESTPKSNTIEEVVLVGDTIWVATDKGLCKSTDNGVNWTNYYGTADFGTECISSVAYGDGIICAATWHYEETTEGRFPYGTGLKISTNYGRTWIKVAQMMDPLTDTTVVYGNNILRAETIATPFQNFIRDIAVVNNTIWVVGNSSGLRKSTDLGATWQRVVLPPDNLDSIKPTDTLNFLLKPQNGVSGSYNHIGFAVAAVDKDTLYVGTAGGINKSTDGGISWTKFSHQNQTSPISGNHILKIRYNKFDKSVWAATWKAMDENEFWGVSSSFNGGQTWKVTLNDSRTLDFVFPEIKSGSVTTGTDVIAMTQEGLYRTSNRGNTWISSPAIRDDQTKISLLTEYFTGGAVNNNSNSISELWFATYDGLVRLSQPISNFWEGTWSIFFASQALESKDESYAFPNPFSPGLESVRIKYSLPAGADVTIRILDFGMNLVKTLIQNAPRNAGNCFDTWSGRDENGKIVPNGVYFYRIDIGDEKPLFGKILAAR